MSVNIMSIDPSSSSMFSQGVSSQLNSQLSGGALSALSGLSASSGSGSSGMITQPNGNVFIVDKDGEIELPLLGKFKCEGITTDSLKNLISVKTAEYYKSPVVIVRFANLKVNVLGEVLKPGLYNLPNEKNTILDALAMAGDLTIYAKRGNVILIRDSSGFSKIQRFDLNSKDLLKQDFYYLKQNDVIYVEPTKAKSAVLDADRTRQISIAAAVLSLLIVVATRL